jgi:hypothetical protein
MELEHGVELMIDGYAERRDIRHSKFVWKKTKEELDM